MLTIVSRNTYIDNFDTSGTGIYIFAIALNKQCLFVLIQASF